MTAVTMLAKARSADRRIGAILVEAAVLTSADVERVLKLQAEEGIRFGEAGVKLGLLTEADVMHALAVQFDYPYLPAGPNRPISDEVVVAYEPFGPAGEAIRAVRSQLQLRWFDKALQRTTLAVVSPGEGDGRSYMVANLAVAFAQMGERTLIIDADMRAPRQHKLFKYGNEVGLSNVLAGRTQDGAVTFVPGIAGLALLPAGPKPPNPLELLSRPGFERVLEQSMATFDVVLIDTPALGIATDAMAVLRYTGAALAVARKEHTRKSQFTSMVAQLAQSGVSVVGTVMLDPSRVKRRAK